MARDFARAIADMIAMVGQRAQILERWGSRTTIDAREENWGGAEPLFLQAYDVVWIPNTPIDEVGIWIDNYIRRMIPFPYIVPPLY